MRWRTRFLGKALLILAAVAVLGGVVMLLWNAVVPGLFAGARPLDFVHAVGLLVLSRILFGGFRGHGGWGGGRRWRQWRAMTPEERATVLDEMQARGLAGRCGRGRPRAVD